MFFNPYFPDDKIRAEIQRIKERKEEMKKMLEQAEIKVLYELKWRIEAARAYYQSNKFPSADDMAAILGIQKKEENEERKYVE